MPLWGSEDKGISKSVIYSLEISKSREKFLPTCLFSGEIRDFTNAELNSWCVCAVPKIPQGVTDGSGWGLALPTRTC